MRKQRPTFTGAMAACTLSLVLCSSNSAVAETDGLPNLAPGQSLGIALDIPPVPNLRDVGGYKTRDGATIARGLAYRSDTFYFAKALEIDAEGQKALSDRFLAKK